MSRVIMLIPTDINVGLTSVSLGVIRSIEQQKISLSIFKPISQLHSASKNQKNEVFHSYSRDQIAEPLKMSYVESLLSKNQRDILMEEIISLYNDNKQQTEVILIEGLRLTNKHPFVQSLNYSIAKTLGADVVFVTTPGNRTTTQLKNHLELARVEFNRMRDENITGVIINKLNSPVDDYGHNHPDLSEIFNTSNKVDIAKIDIKKLSNNNALPILGCIPWNFDLIATRGIDIANHLNAFIINEGDLKKRRIKSIVFCACSTSNMTEFFRLGSLLVISSDRPEVIISACLAAMNGVEIGALLLTGGYVIEKPIRDLCYRSFKTGLPVLMVDTNTWQTSLSLQNFSLKANDDDHERIENTKNYIALHINQTWIHSLTTNAERPKRLSPPAFRYQLTELARKANKRIVLPEGNEPRTVKATAICAKRGIARCVLLGDPDEIKLIAATQGVALGSGIEIIAPKSIRQNYVKRLVELRKNKGMTEIIAQKQLQDNVVLGTMMLEKNEVDGLVSGAIHTTANTIRPPLQLINSTSGSSCLFVSSIFFMLLPDQVLIYGDCAINPDPTAEQLSEIAIQSADSAREFGIEPRVAMLSYATGNSSAGSDVEKVREATRLAQAKRPDLIIDGPLQYDAAIMVDVATSKAPHSPVAGKATVFIFPDLNSGNTTYKAVQRSANLVSIGPMLQGMRKPVNDLSRGALIDDIVYTIALTAIQAMKIKITN